MWKREGDFGFGNSDFGFLVMLGIRQLSRGDCTKSEFPFFPFSPLPLSFPITTIIQTLKVLAD